jgi:hypothetical protein
MSHGESDRDMRRKIWERMSGGAASPETKREKREIKKERTLRPSTFYAAFDQACGWGKIELTGGLNLVSNTMHVTLRGMQGVKQEWQYHNAIYLADTLTLHMNWCLT